MENTVEMRWWCRGFGSAWGQKRPLVVSSSCCPPRCWTPTWFRRTAVLEFLRSCSWRTLVSRVWDDCKQAKKKKMCERGALIGKASVLPCPLDEPGPQSCCQVSPCSHTFANYFLRKKQGVGVRLCVWTPKKSFIYRSSMQQHFRA